MDNDYTEGTAGHYYVNMPAGGTSTLTLSNANITTFKVYDNGGKDGHYGQHCNGTLVLTAPTGYNLQLSGNITTSGEDYDYLCAYDGTNSSSNALLNNVRSASSGTPTSITTVTSTGQSMTLYFHSNGITNDGEIGLDLTVTLIKDNTAYGITVNNPATGGTIATDKTSTLALETVTLTASPSSGYMLSNISVMDASSNAVSVAWDGPFSNTATFTMPGSAVTVTPTFTNTLTVAGGLYTNMPTTGTKSVTIPSGVQSLKVYDNSGKDGNYSDNCNGILMLTAPTGYVLQLSGNIKTQSGYDCLWVYDGSTTSSTKLLNAVSSASNGTQTAITTITSSGTNMTIDFHSNDNTNYAGLDLTVTLVPAPVNIIDGVGNVITADDEITVPTLDYIRNFSAPGATPDANVGGVDVDVYTLCLPYAPATGEGIKYYTLNGSSGSTLQFTEVDNANVAANTPYLVTVSAATSVGKSIASPVELKKKVTNSVTAGDYTFKGTTIGLTNAEAVTAGAYILMVGNQWGLVMDDTDAHRNAYIPPFRAYIVSTSGVRSLDNEFGDGDTTRIQSLQLIDRDGTEQWFDLSGRRIEKPTRKGLYIVNGKKVIKR